MCDGDDCGIFELLGHVLFFPYAAEKIEEGSVCGNYRGISLLSIAGKILARVILNRLISNISENNLPEAQCGFRPGRCTIDMIFAVRQVQEKCREQNLDLHADFIDVTKAFDTVNRVALSFRNVAVPESS
ncbi:hypothetical protein ACOMHN_053520 [Nucella lapillus]